MPAFTFEKISPPDRATTKSVTIADNNRQAPKPHTRGFIASVIERLAVARLKRVTSKLRAPRAKSD